jgi:hypothetical protein
MHWYKLRRVKRKFSQEMALGKILRTKFLNIIFFQDYLSKLFPPPRKKFLGRSF